MDPVSFEAGFFLLNFFSNIKKTLKLYDFLSLIWLIQKSNLS
jgi:hypothetical protein